jgi:hypothetical protein
MRAVGRLGVANSRPSAVRPVGGGGTISDEEGERLDGAKSAAHQAQGAIRPDAKQSLALGDAQTGERLGLADEQKVEGGVFQRIEEES